MVDPTVERTPKHAHAVVTLEGEQLHGWLREKLGTPPNATAFKAFAYPSSLACVESPFVLHRLHVYWDEPEAVAEGKA